MWEAIVDFIRKERPATLFVVTVLCGLVWQVGKSVDDVRTSVNSIKGSQWTINDETRIDARQERLLRKYASRANLKWDDGDSWPDAWEIVDQRPKTE